MQACRTSTAEHLGLMIVSAALFGCAQVLGIEDTEFGLCAYEGGEGPGGGPLVVGDADFSCVGDLRTLEPATPEIEITLEIGTLRTSGLTRIEGITVKACGSRADGSCDSPVGVARSDEDGVARLTVPTRAMHELGYDGYFVFEGPDARGVEWQTYLQFFSRPLVENRTFPIMMVTPTDFQEIFIDTVGADNLIQERGWLAVEMVDCNDAPGPNMKLGVENSCEHLDEHSAEFYFSGGSPSPSLEETQLPFTAGGFLNIKPTQDFVLSSYWRIDEQNLETVRDHLVIRAGSLTTLRFIPNL